MFSTDSLDIRQYPKFSPKILMNQWEKYLNLAYIATNSMILVYNPYLRNMNFFFSFSIPCIRTRLLHYKPTICTHFFTITITFQYTNSYMFRASLTHHQELHRCWHCNQHDRVECGMFFSVASTASEVNQNCHYCLISPCNSNYG